MYFKQERTISTESSNPLELVERFIYIGNNISSTESDIHIRLAKAWAAINMLLIIWKSDLPNKIKWDIFQAVAVSVLLYGCTF